MPLLACDCIDSWPKAIVRHDSDQEHGEFRGRIEKMETTRRFYPYNGDSQT